MEVARFFIAFGIGISIALLLVESVSLFIETPSLELAQCYEQDMCSNIIASSCSSLILNYSSYNECVSNMVRSVSYIDCRKDADAAYQSCLAGQNKDVERFQMISLGIFGIIGLASLTIGFLLIRHVSIGSGLIFGGILLTLFAGVFAAFNTFSMLLSSSFISLTQNENSDAFAIIRIVLYLITLFILIFMGYFFVEKKAKGYSAEKSSIKKFVEQ